MECKPCGSDNHGLFDSFFKYNNLINLSCTAFGKKKSNHLEISINIFFLKKVLFQINAIKINFDQRREGLKSGHYELAEADWHASSKHQAW